MCISHPVFLTSVSLRASSPIWASEASLRRENAGARRACSQARLLSAVKTVISLLSAFLLILYMVQVKRGSTLTAACLPGATKNFIRATKFRIIGVRSGK